MQKALALVVLFACAAPAIAQEVRVTGEPIYVIGSADAPFFRPIWSPSGDRIASTGSNFAGIYTLRPDGSELSQLSAEDGAGFSAQWSPDGSALLARVSRVEGVRRYHAVKVFHPETGSEQQLTEYRASMPVLPRWSSDGVHVLLPGADRAEVLDASGIVGEREMDGAAPVVFDQNQAIAVASADVPTARRVRSFPEGNVLRLSHSADGQRVVFEIMGGNLFVMNADGSELVDLGPGEAGRFSPDGQWVVFMRTTDDGHAITGSDLYAARADGTETLRLTDTPDRIEMHPDWSPDGRFIAFDDRGSIFLLPVVR
jgi:Tol biopolymer transport system component